MSIYGVSNSTISRPTNPLPLRDNGRTQPQLPGTAKLPAASQPLATTQTPAAAKSSQSLSAEPPAGTDPALWSVLSSDERAFFAKAGAMGPLTYGRALREQNVQMPASRGGRLDVKI
ncbi:MAG TPA: hypothetical protein VGM67_18885 [Gemmatimonadaceae bacterium]|jgi:hypothetical protein